MKSFECLNYLLRDLLLSESNFNRVISFEAKTNRHVWRGSRDPKLHLIVLPIHHVFFSYFVEKEGVVESHTRRKGRKEGLTAFEGSDVRCLQVLQLSLEWSADVFNRIEFWNVTSVIV